MHAAPVTVMRYNAVHDTVISGDEKGAPLRDSPVQLVTRRQESDPAWWRTLAARILRLCVRADVARSVPGIFCIPVGDQRLSQGSCWLSAERTGTRG